MTNVAGFTPSVNGFAFDNGWPSESRTSSSTSRRSGKVTIGDASNGLCGGMVFTVKGSVRGAPAAHFRPTARTGHASIRLTLRELQPSWRWSTDCGWTAPPVSVSMLNLIGLTPLMDRTAGSREVAIGLLDGTFVASTLCARRGSAGGRR